MSPLRQYLRQWRPSVMKWHWLAGRHSRFPTCDILWYFARTLSGWPWILSSHPRLMKLWWAYSDFLGHDKRPETHHYVRCPICVVRGRFVEMHICDMDCMNEIGWCGEQPIIERA